MNFSEFVRRLQADMNKTGLVKLSVDGDLGPKTKAAIEKFDILFALSPIVSAPMPEKPTPPTGNGPIQWFEQRLGWHESNPEHSKQLSIGWALTKYCKDFKTVEGNSHAWCGMSLATALSVNAYQYPEQCETASKWIGCGTEYDWKANGIIKGSIIVLKHPGYHVTLAHENTEPNPTYVDCIGGNQSNSICVQEYNAHDIVWCGLPIKNQTGMNLSGLTEGDIPFYKKAYDIMQFDKGEETKIAETSKKVLSFKDRYEPVAKSVFGGVDLWFIVGCIHMMEASCNFKGVLHNGEPIIGTDKKTTLVPAGRGPFKTWEESAVDALTMNASRWAKVIDGDHSIPQILYACERYNGTGYLTGAGKSDTSPYIWAGSSINDGTGKYVADGKYDPNAKVGTVGIATMIKWFELNGYIKL